jgi:hypothetical protein
MNYFKDHCNYDKIITHLSSNIENFKNEHNIFCDYFARKYPLNLKTIQNKPRPPKKNIITPKEYFFDDYDFIDEQILNLFLEEFNVFNGNRLFNSYEVIIKNDIFIVIYDINNLEVMTKNERLLFSVDNSKDLRMIKDAFKFSNFKNALRELNIKDIDIPEQIIVDKMNCQIGKMRNLSLIMNDNENNNQLRNYKTENNFYKNNLKNDPMLNDYNYNYNYDNQNTLYQSYDKIPNNNNNINIPLNYDYGNKYLESNSPKKYYSGKKLNSFYNFFDDKKDKPKIENNSNINKLGETGNYLDDNQMPNKNKERKNMQNNNIPINKIENQRNYYSNNYENNENTKLSHLYENNEPGNKLNKYYLRNKSANPNKTYMDSNKQKQNNLNLNYIDRNKNSYNTNDNNMRKENIENSMNFVNEYMESGKKQKINNKNNNNKNIKNNNININNNHLKKLNHYPNNNSKSLYNNNINLFNKNNDNLNKNNIINNNDFDFNNNKNLNNKNIHTRNNESGFEKYNSSNYNFRGNRIILI